MNIIVDTEKYVHYVPNSGKCQNLIKVNEDEMQDYGLSHKFQEKHDHALEKGIVPKNDHPLELEL